MADDRFYVKTLRLQNFRCFEDVTLGPFDPHFNLLVGENGAGKSSVLVALAHLFAPMGTEPNRPIPTMGKPSDIRRYQGSEDVLTRKLPFHAVLDARFFPAASPFAARLRKESDIQLTISEDPDAAVAATRAYPSFFALTRHERAQESNAVPLIAFYPACRRFLAEISPSPRPEKLSYPRFAALNGWANAGLQSEALTEWLRDETLAKYQDDARYYIVRGDTEDPESGYFIDLVVGAVVRGVEGAKQIEYGGRVGEIVLTYQDGRKQKLSEMSDGQRSLVCLIADLARRICILNGANLKERTLLETPGLVLIDEIDLHLHPKWQRRIISALKTIFPKIQFFATTHSPQVIGEAKPEEIVVLTPQGQERPAGGYGMDSNWILESVMNAPERNPEVGRRIRHLFELIDADRLAEAKAQIQSLRQELPEVAPDIASAETLIWNLEHDAGEAAE